MLATNTKNIIQLDLSSLTWLWRSPQCHQGFLGLGCGQRLSPDGVIQHGATANSPKAPQALDATGSSLRAAAEGKLHAQVLKRKEEIEKYRSHKHPELTPTVT